MTIRQPFHAAASLLPLGAVALLFAACSPPSAPPAPPPPLTAAQHAAALARGKAIAAETFGVLSTNLQTALASGGVSNALPFCSLAASPLTASVATRHGVALRRITHKPRNAAARASDLESAVLDAFRAALTPGGPPPAPLATNLVAGQATFFAPIVLNHTLCLNCHGEPGKDIPEANLALIRQHYPQDEATGFKLGDLRGAWRIDIPLAKLDGEGK
jgi:hypothetical protein